MEDTPTENAPRRRGPLRTAKRAAEFLTAALGETITEDMIFDWSRRDKIRHRKFGHNITFEPDELLEDVRGKEDAA